MASDFDPLSPAGTPIPSIEWGHGEKPLAVAMSSSGNVLDQSAVVHGSIKSLTNLPPVEGSSAIRLRPFAVDPPSDEDLADLLAQRVACGWKANHIPTWVKEIQEGHRLMWFIQSPEDPSLFQPDPSAFADRSIGMVSLALHDPTDLTLANLRAPSSPGTRAEISALFIYPEHRRKGFGEQAIRKMEHIAKELGVTVTTMNTSAAGEELARYRRLGYEEYRPREKRYPLHEILACGWTEEHCFAAFVEKSLV